MEVTNNNSNPFSVKLRSASPQTFASDTFSTHLRENQPDVRSQTDDRNSPADRQSARAEKAEATERAQAAEERNAARSRDHDRETYDAAERDAHDERPANETSDEVASLSAATTPLDSTDEEELIFSATLETNPEEPQPEDQTEPDSNTATPDAEGHTVGLDDATQTDDTSDQSQQTTTDIAGPPSAEANTSVGNIAETSETPETGLTEQPHGASITTAQAATSNPTPQPTPTGTQNATPETTTALGGGDKTTGTPNPIGENFGGDTDTGGDGEKSLGQQASETLASKNKTTAASTNTPTLVMQPVTPATQTVPTQPLAALGLNATNLTANLDLDLLGLNSNGQPGVSGAPQNANPLLVRFGALPGQAQATQVPNTAIALQIAKHVAKGVSTFEIRLDPPEMGRIDIKLELAQDGRVTAHLTVEKADTLDLMQRDSKALEQALRDAGLAVDADTLNFSLQKEGGGGGGDGTDVEQNANGLGDDLDAEDAPRADIVTALAARQIEAAARGGIDLSI